MTWTPDICIHHHPCDDGFAAAWIVHQKWGDAVEFIGMNYGQPLPEHFDPFDKRILIADFSFKPDVLSGIADKALSVVILDHHKTAEADLSGLQQVSGSQHDTVEAEFDRLSLSGDWFEKVLASFDMDRCGASMTWEFCFPGDPLPPFIRYIEDRDLWNLAIPESRAFSLYLRSFPMEFELWSAVAARSIDDLDGLLNEARAIERFYDRKIEEWIPAAVRWQTIAGDSVPVLNVPWSFASDSCHSLLAAYPEAPFVAAYFDNGDGRSYSLRSEDARRDVSEVARVYGGGGHRNAAGFRVPL